MAQSAERFLLDLPHALSGQIEAHSDLFQRERLFAVQPEIQAQHFGLAVIQRGEHVSDLFAHRVLHDFRIGGFLRFVGQHMKQAVVVFLAERRIQRPDVARTQERILHHLD